MFDANPLILDQNLDNLM